MLGEEYKIDILHIRYLGLKMLLNLLPVEMLISFTIILFLNLNLKKIQIEIIMNSKYGLTQV